MNTSRDEHESIDIRTRLSRPAFKAPLRSRNAVGRAPKGQLRGRACSPLPGCATWFSSAPAHPRWRTRKRPGRDLGLPVVPPDLYLGAHAESANCRLNFGCSRLTFTTVTIELVTLKHSSLRDNDDVCWSWCGLCTTCLQFRAKLRVLTDLSFSHYQRQSCPGLPTLLVWLSVSCSQGLSAQHGPPTHYGPSRWPPRFDHPPPQTEPHSQSLT